MVNYLEKLNRKKGELNSLISEKSDKENKIKKLSEYQIILEQVQTILQEVGQKTQKQIKFHIEDIVTLAIDTIFPNKYNFVMDFVLRRGKTECDLFIEDYQNNRYSILDTNGGGLADIISFGLRIALWSLKFGKKSNTIILDEPFKFLSRDLQEQAGELIKKLSEKLKLQIIMVTHIPALYEQSNNIIKVGD